MYELIQAGENTYYIDCPSKIGICRTGAGVYLIDSGNDRDAGKKVLKILERNGWPLLGILATHAHADHIGGCRYLQDRTGCKVFAHGVESAFAAYPILEPAFLYGGYPPKDLRRKFLVAQESRVSPLSDPDFPGEIQAVPLPGLGRAQHVLIFSCADYKRWRSRAIQCGSSTSYGFCSLRSCRSFFSSPCS